MPRQPCPGASADEATDATNALLTRLRTSDQAIVPDYSNTEVANALLMAIRRKRISRQDTLQFLEDLLALPVRIEATAISLLIERIIPLAEQYQLTAYDAGYLELALSNSLPLATLDTDLRRAARAERVALLL